MMYHDEVIAEVWRNRDAYVAEHHHDLDEIIADLKRRQAERRELLIDRRASNESQQMAGQQIQPGQ